MLNGTKFLDKVSAINQKPIGRTPRSKPATYTGLFTYVRDLFSKLPESKIRGYKPGRFSFNVKGGRCESCEGDGIIKIEMNFLPDVYVVCEVCNGKRYNRETLEIIYKGKTIHEIRVSDVLEAGDESLNALHTGAGAKGAVSGSKAQSLSNRLWEGLSAHVYVFLHQTRLSDVIENELAPCPAVPDLISIVEPAD